MGSVAKAAKEGSELLEAQQRALIRRVRVPFPPFSGRGKEEGGTWVRPTGGGAQIKGGRLRPPPPLLNRKPESQSGQLGCPMSAVAKTPCGAGSANRQQRWADAGGRGGAAEAERPLRQEGRWRTRRSCRPAGRSV